MALSAAVFAAENTVVELASVEPDALPSECSLDVPDVDVAAQTADSGRQTGSWS